MSDRSGLKDFCANSGLAEMLTVDRRTE